MQHVVQADCHRPVRRNAGVQDHLCHNKVGPRRQEGADNGVHQDRAGHRDDDLEEDARFRSAVQLGGLTQCHRHRIKKALTDQVAQAGRARVYHDQTGVRVGQVHVLQNKVHSDHGQNAGEQVDGNGQVLQQLAALEAAAAYGVSHHQHKAGVVAAIFSHQLKFSDATGNPYPEWTSCTLQDAVDFLDGQRKPLESADRAKRQGQYPYYGASGIIDYIDDFIFDEPLLLLGEDGANILNRSTPLCFIAEGKYWVNNHAHVMRPKAGQNIKFLCELLESLDYTRYNTGTAQPKLNQDKCRRIGLALPVYEEQCHIADFLSAFDQRTDKAQSILDYLLSNRDGLLQQLFI